jgi:hypothetical protein
MAVNFTNIFSGNSISIENQNFYLIFLSKNFYQKMNKMKETLKLTKV